MGERGRAIARRRTRRDDNEPEIIEAFLDAGATVYVMDKPLDLLVGIHGHNILVEVKDGSKPPSRRQLTKDEDQFMMTWKGSCHVIDTADDARALIETYKRK